MTSDFNKIIFVKGQIQGSLTLHERRILIIGLLLDDKCDAGAMFTIASDVLYVDQWRELAAKIAVTNEESKCPPKSRNT